MSRSLRSSKFREKFDCERTTSAKQNIAFRSSICYKICAKFRKLQFLAKIWLSVIMINIVMTAVAETNPVAPIS